MSSGLSKITPTTLAITLAIALVGCGRLTPGQLRVSASTWNPGSSTVSDPDSDYNCPSGNNVVPEYDWSRDGSGQFQVCASKTNLDDILIHGKTASETQICVFPAQYQDSLHVYVKPDPKQPDLAWSTCVDTANAAQVILTFQDANYNAVFIVENSARSQMTSCLMQGNSQLCPSYSFGKFR